jgi:ribonuclease P protein component
VRFGFIVAKSVGIAVRRNLVRRRFKAACHELISRTAPGTDIVIRALPGAASQPFGVLCEEIATLLRKGSVLA